MKQSEHHFWHSRQRREKILLVLCLIVMLTALLGYARYFAVAWQQQAAGQLQRRQQAWQQMQQLEERMKMTRPEIPDDRTLQRMTGLPLRHTPDGVLIAEPAIVQFQPLLNAMIALEQRYRLQAYRLRLEQDDTTLRLTCLELRNDR